MRDLAIFTQYFHPMGLGSCGCRIFLPYFHLIYYCTVIYILSSHWDYADVNFSTILLSRWDCLFQDCGMDETYEAA